MSSKASGASRTSSGRFAGRSEPVAALRAWRGDLLCAAALLAVTLTIHAPALFGGRVLLPADIVPLMRPWAVSAPERFPDLVAAQNPMIGPIFEYYSWRYAVRERLRQGEVPLWNPYAMSGNVLLANSQSAVLYPPNLLLWALPLATGINLVTALHTFLAGLFAFGFLRTAGLGRPASMTGALGWMLCGPMVVWQQFQTPTAVLTWLPAGLWAWERFARDEHALRTIGWLAAVVAMVLLAGHLHFAFYTLLAICIYAAIRSAASSRPPFVRARPLAVLMGGVALGGALSAVTMLPVVEMGQLNFRGRGLTYAEAISKRLPADHLVLLALPRMLGYPPDHMAIDPSGRPVPAFPYFGRYEFIEYTGYTGIAALVLAFVGLAGALPGRRRVRVGMATIAAVGLLLALGTALCAVLYYGVPGYRQFHATARALCLFAFGISGLAALGVERILASPDTASRRRAGIALAVGSVLAAVAALTAYPGMAARWPQFEDPAWRSYALGGLRHALLCVAGVAAVAVLARSPNTPRWMASLIPCVVAVDLFAAIGRFNPATDPAMLGYPTAVTDALLAEPGGRVVSLEKPDLGLKSMIVPNYNAVVGLHEAQGADSLHWVRYHRLMERVVLAMEPGRDRAFVDTNTIRVPDIDHPVFDLLDVRRVTTFPGWRSRRADLVPAGDYELQVWRNPRAMGPARVVGRARRVTGGEALDALATWRFDPASEALLEETSPPLDGLAGGSAEALTFQPHRLEYAVTAPGRSLLVESQIGLPGWRATVNGRPAPVLSADYVLRAVPVPAGRSVVRVWYDPASYRVGLFLTCIALAGIAAGWVCRSQTRKPQ